MTTSLLLRIVAIVALLQFVGHGTLFVRARPTHGPDEVAVVDAMRTHTFAFAASPRSYWDMYFGYGLEAAAICLVEAVLFWLPAGAASTAPALVQSIALLFAAANAAHIAMLARYFAFPLPMAFDGIIAAGLLAAAFTSR
jgi:hypothetical protein